MPLRNLGHHPLGVEDAGFIDDVARLDARGFFDEVGRGVGFGLYVTRCDRLAVVSVVKINPGIERGNQFLITNALSRREQS